MKHQLRVILASVFLVICLTEGGNINQNARSVNTDCTDRHVWIADGSVDCKYLTTASFWGLHKNPDHWCNDYILTECCETCNRLREENIIN